MSRAPRPAVRSYAAMRARYEVILPRPVARAAAEVRATPPEANR
jgi:hypothetical protein